MKPLEYMAYELAEYMDPNFVSTLSHEEILYYWQEVLGP